MKRIKLLPSILMLVLCVGVLAMGVYAATPATNTISGQISVTSASAEVQIQVFEDEVKAGNEISDIVKSRAGKPVPYNAVTIDPSGHEVATEVLKEIIVQVKNLSNKEIGVYFSNGNTSEEYYNEENGTVLQSGIQIEPITLTDIVGEEDSKNVENDPEDVDFAKVYVDFYTQAMPKGSTLTVDEEEIATDVIEMRVKIHLQEFHEISNFNLNLNLCVEDYIAGRNSTANSTFVKLSSNTTTINEYYFTNENITSITMPNVTSINSYAFNDCTENGIIAVSMPRVISLPEDVFSSYFGLTNITFPMVTSCEGIVCGSSLIIASLPRATELAGTFSGCTNLKVVSIPNVTSIGDESFSGCISLTSIQLPKVTTIGESAFNGCTGLTSLTLPEATTINSFAFSDWTTLTDIKLPKVTYIGEGAFSGCTGLTSLTLPEVTSIDYESFSGCISLTSIQLPKATTIGDFSFLGCADLISLQLPEVTEVYMCAFQNCTSLISVTMPKVSRIGEWAFSGCTSLNSVVMPSEGWIYIDDASTNTIEISIPSSELATPGSAAAKLKELHSDSDKERPLSRTVA